jgi:hypothetical protein
VREQGGESCTSQGNAVAGWRRGRWSVACGEWWWRSNANVHGARGGGRAFARLLRQRRPSGPRRRRLGRLNGKRSGVEVTLPWLPRAAHVLSPSLLIPNLHTHTPLRAHRRSHPSLPSGCDEHRRRSAARTAQQRAPLRARPPAAPRAPAAARGLRFPRPLRRALRAELELQPCAARLEQRRRQWRAARVAARGRGRGRGRGKERRRGPLAAPLPACAPRRAAA